MPKTERVILAVILFIGTVLRIYNYWDFSLSNDELSALARLNFTSFYDLIQNGVKIDGHPAAAQVILYYSTKIFGNSVAVVRFPFVLAGILAVYYMYRLGKEWVSSSAGLLSAAVFASLSFPILYSRIARPYSLGMLFALMAATYWIRIIKERGSNKDFILLAVSLTLCAYSHYFCAMVAAILAISGTFLIQGQNLKKYIIALVAAFVLYLPYIPIFLYQLNLGGVGQWLGPPENDWLIEHLAYVLNNSWIVILSVLTVCIMGFTLFKSKKSFQRNLLPLLLFLLPFLIGFLYSKNINPVLQHSTLLFSFPFFLVFLFSGWEDSKPRITAYMAGLLVILTVGSTVLEKRFYQTNHFGVFKEVAENLVKWKNESDDDALLIGDYNYPFYLHYYTDQIEPLKLDLYRTTDELGLAKLKSLVEESRHEYLIYSWSTINQVPEIEAIIKQRFPNEVNRETYFNSEVVRFQKGKAENIGEVFDFEKTENWNFNPDAIKLDSLNNQFALVSAQNPYGPTYTAKVSELKKAGYTEVLVYVDCIDFLEGNSMQMVYEQVNDDSGGYAWESDEFKRQFFTNGPTWGVFQYSLKEPKSDSDILKIYPWLPNGEGIALKRMRVRFR
jgi:hypothetical protein